MEDKNQGPKITKLGCCRVRWIPISQLGKPSMRWRGNGQEFFGVTATRQSIGHAVLNSTAIEYFVAKTQKLSEYPLLPQGVQSLLIEVYEAFLIRVDEEFILQQIMAPLIDGHNNSEILLLYVDNP